MPPKANTQPKPLSEARLAANRANAQRSTGPRTPESKARSAANATRHGFTGSSFAVARVESPDEIDKLKADLVATYQPINSQEMLAIERMAMAQQSIFRAARLESGLFTSCLNDVLDPSGRLFTPMQPDMIAAHPRSYNNVELAAITCNQNRNFGMAEGFDRNAQKGMTWPLFLRYQAQSERMYRRGLEDLLRLRAMRDELATPQQVSEQAPAEPDPVLAPHELNRFAFPDPKNEFPNEPTNPPNPINPNQLPPPAKPSKLRS